MGKTNDVYDMVASVDGIKCDTIHKALNMTQSATSCILTHLKYQKRVYNKHGIWYITSNAIILNDVIRLTMLDDNEIEIEYLNNDIEIHYGTLDKVILNGYCTVVVTINPLND